MRDVAGVANTDAEELPGDTGDAVVNQPGLVGGADLVDEEVEAALFAAFARENFDDSIGIRDGGRLGRGDDQHIVGGTSERKHVGADACAGVDENDVGLLLEQGKGIDQALAVVVR